MQARITRIDAEQAIREGRETARLNRVIEEMQEQIGVLTRENAVLTAKLRMNRSIIERHNRVLALKYEGMREGREMERREARGNIVDALIIGAALGALLAVGIACWMVMV